MSNSVQFFRMGEHRFIPESNRQVSRRLEYLGVFNAKGHNVIVSVFILTPRGWKVETTTGFEYPNALMKRYNNIVSIHYLSPWGTTLQKVDVKDGKLGHYTDGIITTIDKGDIKIGNAKGKVELVFEM